MPTATNLLCVDIASFKTLAELSVNEQELFFKKVNPEIGVDVLEELDLEQQIEIISKFKVNVVISSYSN